MASYSASSSVHVNGKDYMPFTWAFNTSIGAPITLISGVYYALPPYGEPPYEFEPQFDDRKVVFPGTDEVATKRFGFRGRQIIVALVVVGQDKAEAERTKADLLSVENLKKLNRYTVGIPDGPRREGCKLMSCGTISQWTLSESICLLLPLMFEQLSETN